MSTSNVRLPDRASAAARLIEVVVLPTPPFWFAMQNVVPNEPSLVASSCWIGGSKIAGRTANRFLCFCEVNTIGEKFKRQFDRLSFLVKADLGSWKVGYWVELAVVGSLRYCLFSVGSPKGQFGSFVFLVPISF